ncbi:MAG: hypothetical protein HYZ53_14410 [Planctomycetes bacterium]|nr:hypothetical protein [Planctomycetota bacterium]
MEARDSLLPSGVLACLLGVLLLLAGAIFFVTGSRPATAPAPPSGVGAAAASGAHSFAWKSATRNADGSWMLVVTLTRGSQRWDRLRVEGEVVGWEADGGPWSAKLAAPIPSSPPDALELSFTTGPLPHEAGQLALRVRIDSSYSGLTGAGNSSSSGIHRFPVPSPAGQDTPAAREAQEARGTPVVIPVAERSVCGHLDALQAQSPFRRPGPGEPRVAGPAGERRMSWGAEGTFWSALLDLRTRAGLCIEDVRASVWLGVGPERRRGLVAAGPALVGVGEVKEAAGEVRFSLWAAFEPAESPDGGLLNVPRLAATVGGRPTRLLSTSLNENTCEWRLALAAGDASGPLEAVVNYEKGAGFANVELEPVAGATRHGPQGAWSVTVARVTPAAITTAERGLQVAGRCLILPNEEQVAPAGGEGALRDGEYTAKFGEPIPAGATYVLRVQMAARKIRFRARIESPDWEAWRQGR